MKHFRAQKKPRKQSMNHNLEIPSSLLRQKCREMEEYETEKTGWNHTINS